MISCSLNSFRQNDYQQLQKNIQVTPRKFVAHWWLGKESQSVLSQIILDLFVMLHNLLGSSELHNYFFCWPVDGCHHGEFPSPSLIEMSEEYSNPMKRKTFRSDDDQLVVICSHLDWKDLYLQLNGCFLLLTLVDISVHSLPFRNYSGSLWDSLHSLTSNFTIKSPPVPWSTCYSHNLEIWSEY